MSSTPATYSSDGFASGEDVCVDERPFDLESDQNDICSININNVNHDWKSESGNSDILVEGRESKALTIISESTPEINLASAEKGAVRLSEQEKKEDALKEFIRCVVLSKIAFGEDDWMVAKYHVILATSYLDLKGYAEQAVHHCNVADNILSHLELSGRKPEQSSEVLKMLMQKEHSHARAQMALKKLSVAESSLTKTKQLFETWSRCSKKGETKNWELKIATAFGRLYMLTRRWELSIKYFEKALELQIDENGRNCVGLIPIYQNLGKLEQCRKPADHEKAVGHYLQAHSIATLNYGSKSLKAANTSFTMALSFANISNPEAESSAESYLKESLGIYRSLGGDNHLKVLEVIDELARLYIRTERIMDGIKLLESSMTLREEQCNYYSSKVAGTFKLIASGYMSLGDMEKAWKNFEKCHTIECAIFGSLHRFVESTKKTMDMLLQNPALSQKIKK